MLLAAVDERLAGSPRWDPPLRIVVPSGSLRRHLSSRLVRARGRALVGVRVDTLPGLAREILRRAGEPAGLEAPLELLVAREIEREEALRSHPGELASAATTTIRDLIDAGFEPAHGEALFELLESRLHGVSAREKARARALVRVAARILGKLEEGPFRLDGLDLRQAAEQLALHSPHDLCPARALLVFGFADVTGVAGDLLLELLRSFEGLVVYEEPPRPGQARTKEDSFVARFRERLSGIGLPSSGAGASEAVELRLLDAPEPRLEVEAVLDHIRDAIAEGVEPERIAVLLRDPEPYRLELGHRLARLGVPFTAPGIDGATDPALRPISHLVDLLQPASDPPLDRWLGAAREAGGGLVDLALRTIGLTRLSHLAALELPPRDVQLPIRRGLTLDDEGRPRAPRLQLARPRLERIRQLARSTLAHLDSWPETAPWPDHLARLQRLATELGWPELPPSLAADLSRRLPVDFPLSRSELRRLVQLELRRTGRLPLGGNGAGVRILTVMEARSCSFDRLFVLGLQRGSFPRAVREDPLLPDPLRGQMRVVLPDLPIKSRGFDEDRYLFAQLLTAAPMVTLSWSRRTDHEELGRSPLVESLLRVRPELDPLPVSTGSSTEHPLPPEDHLMSAARAGRLARLLPAGWLEVSKELPSRPLPEVGTARVELLEQIEPPLNAAPRPGPFLGLVGPIREATDPRRRALAVTTVERVVACPWQSLLIRLLGVEAPPDPRSELPALDPRRVGNTVHRTLEALVRRELGPEPRRIPWPSSERLLKLARRVAESLLKEEGLERSALAPGLARIAIPYLETAAALDWSHGLSRLPVREVEGLGRTAGEPSVAFRTDRLDLLEGGLLRTDYKTGAAVSDAKKEETRRRKLLRWIRRGKFLQVVAYAVAEGPIPSEGRLLFLKPELAPELREVTASPSDAELVEAFEETVSIASTAVAEGLFVPRMVGSDGRKEPDLCSRCEVAQACSRGDSGARRRLLRWLDEIRERDEPDGAPLLGLWERVG